MSEAQETVWIGYTGLDENQKQLLAMIINLFGEGMHPFADDITINDFSVSYAKEILAKEEFRATIPKQKKEYKDLLKSIEEVLKEY